MLYVPLPFAISTCAIPPPRRKETLMKYASTDRRVSLRHNFKLPRLSPTDSGDD